MSYGDEQAEARRLRSILEGKPGGSMTPPARPDPVAALLTFLEIEVPYWGGTDGQEHRWEEYKRLIRQARAAPSGYVLVNADMLAEADREFDYEGWKAIPGFPPDDSELEHQQKAAAILAALKGPAR